MTPLWQINGEEKLFDWLATTSDPEERQAMLDWIAFELSIDPAGAAHAHKHRDPGLTLYTTDVDGTNAFVDYLIVEQYHTVMLLQITDLDLQDDAEPESE